MECIMNFHLGRQLNDVTVIIVVLCEKEGVSVPDFAAARVH